jgi:hypothetical protein
LQPSYARLKSLLAERRAYQTWSLPVEPIHTINRFHISANDAGAAYIAGMHVEPQHELIELTEIGI